MFDLLITDATLPDGRKGLDIACRDGRIVAVGRGLSGDAGETLSAAGQLVSPPFVDAHFHMDATLSLGRPRRNRSGTLLEGISLWGELKRIQSGEEIVERALRYCDLAAAMGIGAIRSHVDTSDDELTGVRALLEVRRIVRPWLDLQLVAFPQDGVFRAPNAWANLVRALDLGVDVVGGIPHFERSMAEGARSVTALCELAAERGLPVDMHCDETDDPQSRHVETLAAETHRLGLAGRVAGSHLTSMHSMDNSHVAKLLPLIAEAGLQVIANPLINILLQGRHDTYPRRRGLTRMRELRDAGVTVAMGQDCMMDPWHSLGRADMLDVAAMGLHVGQLSAPDDMRWCFDAVTVHPARILQLPGYGIATGCQANLVLLHAADPVEAIRLGATRLAVIRAGRVIARTPAPVARLDLPGRPARIDPSRMAATRPNSGTGS